MEGLPGHGDGEGGEVRGGGESRGSSTLANPFRCSSSPSQMVIYYAGSAHVFNCMTAEMVQKIMLMAAAAEGVHVAKRTPSLDSSTAEADTARSPTQPQKQQNKIATDASNLLHGLPSELPIARRNSLQRFLEKRRERLVRKAPNHVTKMWENPSDQCSGNEPSTPSSSSKEPATP